MATYSEAAKKRISKIPKKKLRERMVSNAKRRQAKLTPIQKKDQAFLMVQARITKRIMKQNEQ